MNRWACRCAVVLELGTWGHLRMKSDKPLSVVGCALAAVGLLSSHAMGQGYPSKPVRVISPYTAGGANDIICRVIAPMLSESLGQPVVVDNRPGAGSMVGTSLLAKSAPDGYTVMMADIAHGANPALHNKLPYDTLKDFSSVTLVALLPTVLIVHPSLPVKSVKELIALAKSKPRELNYSSSGFGTSNHLAAELFKSDTGIDVVHIPYQGGGQTIAAVLGGQVQMAFITLPATLPHIKTGKVRVLAVSSAKRIAALPEVPTIVESGLPGFEVYLWMGVVAPAGTPSDIVTNLNSKINRVLAIPDVRDRIVGLGADVVGSTPEQLTDFIKAEIARWGKAIKPHMRVD